MSIVKGKDIIIMLQKAGSFIPIATGRDCSLEGTREAIEITSLQSGTDKEFIKGKKSWVINASGLTSFNYASLFCGDDLFNEFNGNDNGYMNFQFIANFDGAAMVYAGKFIMTAYSMKRSYNDVSAFDLSAQISGPVTRTLSGTPVAPPSTTSPIIISPTTIKTFDYTATGGETSITLPAGVTTILLVFRGGVGTGQILLSGTPVGIQVKYNSTTNQLFFSTDSPLLAGEYIKIIYA